MLPTHALGLNEKESKERASNLLKKVGIKEEQFLQKAKDLSGGEMQRVAICRALINEPYCIIADEPTGALDEENSKNIMNILKDISKEKLVILISHNQNLVNEYKDYIIELKDGKRINVDTYNQTADVIIDTNVKKINKKKSHDDRWLFKNVFYRLKKNLTKNILIGCSLLFSFIFLFAMIGFIDGADKLSQTIIYEKIDYGSCYLSKIERKHINNSSLSLDKLSKYKEEEIEQFGEIHKHFYVQDCFDYLIPINSKFSIASEQFSDIGFYPLYSYDNNIVDENLLLNGAFPSNNKKILVNQLADEKIAKQLNLKTSIGQYITFDIDIDMKILSYDGINVDIEEKFLFDKTYQIVGVTKEFSFLSTPRIYYSSKQVQEELEMIVMPNLSYYLNKEISFYDYIHLAKGDNEISSYKHNLFFKDINNIKNLKTIINIINNLYNIDIVCDSITLSDTFINLLDSAKFGVILFVAIAGIGALLILGIASFSSYIFEKKETAIMFAFGFSSDQVFSIFSSENILVSSIAFILSLLIAPLGIILLNSIIKNIFGFESLITNVIMNLNLNVVFLLICIFILITIFVYIATLLPMLFAHKINIKEELSSND